LRADRRAITEMSDPLRAQVADLSRQIQAIEARLQDIDKQIAALVEVVDLGLDKAV